MTASLRPHPYPRASRTRCSSGAAPAIDLGDVTNRCLATSSGTVEGDLPSSRAIALHDSPLSSIRSIELRSALVSLA